MAANIVFFANSTKPEAANVLKNAMRIAHSMGYGCTKIQVTDSPAQTYNSQNKLLVAIGGDGTILKATPFACANDIPILGVNLGRIGFLNEISPDGFENALALYRDGDYTLESRMMLACQMNGEPVADCLNDILLYKQSFSGVAHISIEIDGLDAGTVFCDGMIVCTPTGATGYSISAGGPIIAPGLDACIVTPVCPHSLLVRPIVSAPDSSIRLQMRSVGVLYADGQKIADVTQDDQVFVTHSTEVVRFVRMGPHNLYDLVREKLR
ncbi:NAD(+)/NADH kinase [Eubacteriales bacterium OttesenSCG-928-K08]|nr:NAD(+)/NADH kinase [Eubacteriales bacterium OttesenSCG-928-K08]